MEMELVNVKSGLTSEEQKCFCFQKELIVIYFLAFLIQSYIWKKCLQKEGYNQWCFYVKHKSTLCAAQNINLQNLLKYSNCRVL